MAAETPRAAAQKERQRLVGRRRIGPRWPASDSLTRLRWPFTKRRILHVDGRFNPKTLQRERVVTDKRPFWWTAFLALSLVIPLVSSNDRVLTIATTFAIYASVNLMWLLVMGTAGILSLASLAITGIGAYTACWLSINVGLPWPLMFVAGGVAGLLVGVIISIPARRLDGMYYALLTVGIAEVCRAYALQARWLGAQSQGSLSGGGGFVPESIRLKTSGLQLGYAAAFVLLVLALGVYRAVHGQRLGLLLRSSHRDDEAVAESMGIDYQRARLLVFLISSAALGVIGGFYAAYFRAASLQLFSLDLMLLLFAMIVIGGMGRAEGAVIGTLAVTILLQYYIDWGAWRILIVAALMLVSVIFTRGGAFGLRGQWQELRRKRVTERRAARSSRYGDVLPEEAPDIRDKSQIYLRRYDAEQRERLKALITDEVIEEHRRDPNAIHSEPLDRLLLYFRKGDLPGKYAIYCEQPFRVYRIVALSGLPGVPPRVVDDRTYATVEEAQHAVFLRRIGELKAT